MTAINSSFTNSSVLVIPKNFYMWGPKFCPFIKILRPKSWKQIRAPLYPYAKNKRQLVVAAVFREWLLKFVEGKFDNIGLNSEIAQKRSSRTPLMVVFEWDENPRLIRQ